MNTDDFQPGDPAQIVIGKPEEQSARYHAPQKPKPNGRVPATEQGIKRAMQRRMKELEPAVKEYAALEDIAQCINAHLSTLGKS